MHGYCQSRNVATVLRLVSFRRHELSQFKSLHHIWGRSKKYQGFEKCQRQAPDLRMSSFMYPLDDMKKISNLKKKKPYLYFAVQVLPVCQSKLPTTKRVQKGTLELIFQGLLNGFSLALLHMIYRSSANILI